MKQALFLIILLQNSLIFTSAVEIEQMDVDMDIDEQKQMHKTEMEIESSPNMEKNVDRGDVDYYLAGKTIEESRQIDEAKNGLIALIKVQKDYEFAQRFGKAFKSKISNEEYKNLAKELLKIVELNTKAGLKFIETNFHNEIGEHMVNKVKSEMDDDRWKHFLRTYNNDDHEKAFLFQYIYIAEYINELNFVGIEQAKLQKPNLETQFGFGVFVLRLDEDVRNRKIFTAFLAQWLDTQVLQQLEPKLLPWVIGPLRDGSTLVEFAIRLSLLYAHYQQKDEIGPVKKKAKLQIASGSSSSAIHAKKTKDGWVGLIESYFGLNTENKEYWPVDFHFPESDKNVDEICEGMKMAMNRWEFGEKNGGNIGPKTVTKYIELAKSELKTQIFMKIIKDINMERAKDKKRIEAISFYIRFYRHIMTKLYKNGKGVLFSWLKRVVNFELLYKELSVYEHLMMGTKKGENNLVKLANLLMQPYIVDPIEQKTLAEREQIYRKVIENGDKYYKAGSFAYYEKYKFAIRIMAETLLDREKEEEVKENSGKFAMEKVQTIEKELAEKCGPIENELERLKEIKTEMNIAVEVEKFINQAKVKAENCQNHIFHSGILLDGIKWKVKNGQNAVEVFVQIRREMLKWGEENPLLEDMNRIDKELEILAEKMDPIKWSNEQHGERETIEILYVYARIFHIFSGMKETFIPKLIGKSGDEHSAKSESVLESLLAKDEFFEEKKKYLAKLLERGAKNFRHYK